MVLFLSSLGIGGLTIIGVFAYFLFFAKYEPLD